MTIDEAKGYLTHLKHWKFVPDNLADEALDMAIKALEQQPILEKIRADVEQTRKMYLDMNDIDWLNGCDYVLSVIDKYKAESEVEE